MCWLTYSRRRVCMGEGRTLQRLNPVSGVPIRHFRPTPRRLRPLKSTKDPIHPGSNVRTHSSSMPKYKWVSDRACNIRISLISEQVNRSGPEYVPPEMKVKNSRCLQALIRVSADRTLIEEYSRNTCFSMLGVNPIVPLLRCHHSCRISCILPAPEKSKAKKPDPG